MLLLVEMKQLWLPIGAINADVHCMHPYSVQQGVCTGDGYVHCHKRKAGPNLCLQLSLESLTGKVEPQLPQCLTA